MSCRNLLLSLALTWWPPGELLARPTLCFSDLASGPRAGNTDASFDRAGEDGAIVTVWGTELGADRADSTITVNGVQAARVFYWGDAKPPHSPADLSARLRLQMVIFQVSHLAKDGAGAILVTVRGRKSNALPFTVRPGRVFFVTTRGDDSQGDGTGLRPWRTLPRAVRGMAAGDITYVGDGVKQSAHDAERAALNLSLTGTPTAPCAFVAYPGASVDIGSDRLGFGVRNWLSGFGGTEHWTIAKFRLRAHDIATVVNTGWRIVGNHVTAPQGSSPSGAIEGRGNDLCILGNELTGIGRPGASKLYHPIYISSRRSEQGPRLPPEHNREIAWNYLHDNTANVAINIYSEGRFTAFMSGHRVHHNFIINQVGEGMLLGMHMTGENWVYNNVIANAGLGPEPTDGDRAQNHIGVQISAGAPGGPRATIYFCHNTLYNCGWGKAAWGPTANGAVGIDHPKQYDLVFSNNVIVSAGEPYEAMRDEKPDPRKARNLWFGAGTPPAWDADAIHADPMFVDRQAGDFRLRPGSPAIDAGVDLGREAVTVDMVNAPRPRGKAADLGAYESVVPGEAPVGSRGP